PQRDIRALAFRTIFDSVCPLRLAERAGGFDVERATRRRTRADVHKSKHERRRNSWPDGRYSRGLSELRHGSCCVSSGQVRKTWIRENHRYDGRAIAIATVQRGQWLEAGGRSLWRMGYGRLDSPPSGSRSRGPVNDSIRS